MRVLVVNAGSSSLKLRVLDGDDRVTAEQDCEPGAPASDALAAFVRSLDTVDAVGHRVVHGGGGRPARRIDERTLASIREAAPLAPLHQGAALDAIESLTRLLPDVPAVACFDTAFHHGLPAAAATYALPREWRERYGLRRFGFHGLSHSYAVRRAAELAGRPGDATLRVVSCHLGSGASLCAARGGRSLDTTMGFTPLEGLVMATRSGSVDPGLLLWLINDAGVPAPDVQRVLERESGLAGLAGGDGDMRSVLARRRAGDEQAVRAIDVYVHRLAREIAAMTAALGGIDALVFTGGVGEHAGEIRSEAVQRLTHLGLSLDGTGNDAAEATDRVVSAETSSAWVFVVVAREDLEIARLTREVLEG